MASQAVAALEPPRPRHPMPARMHEARHWRSMRRCGVGVGEAVVLLQRLPARCAVCIFPSRLGERSQGLSVGRLTHLWGWPELQAVLPQPSFLWPRARTSVFRTSVWSLPPEFTEVENRGDGCLKISVAGGWISSLQNSPSLFQMCQLHL